ncbi:MAG TPA: hypothetical protein VMN39_01130, partial [Longimicrobiaceae bacterium]|nr:hypothetical protein [Longimicrobiaceae bacterium]
GDLVMADADGVVVIPGELRAKVTEAALEIEAAEVEIRRAVDAGAPLAAARRDAGYHRLQRPAR